MALKVSLVRDSVQGLAAVLGAQPVSPAAGVEELPLLPGAVVAGELVDRGVVTGAVWAQVRVVNVNALIISLFFGFFRSRPGSQEIPKREERTMSFMDKAKDFADQHDEQVDKGIDKAGDQVDARTGNKHSEQIDRGVDEAQKRTGAGDTQP